MEKFLSNAHTHSTYCDGHSKLTETIAKAKELGFVSLGFSGHAMQGFDWDYSMAEEKQDAYFAELALLQKTEPTLRIWRGLELDSLAYPECVQKAITQSDYLIGSTHYVAREDGSEPVPVDGLPEELRDCIENRYRGDALALVRDYFAAHVASLLRLRPAIIGHFDLVRKYAASCNLFDENSTAYRKLALDALEQAFPCGGVLELNTGAIARGSRSLVYPTMELLCAWREMGGRVTLTSDCHDAQKLDCFFPQALDMFRQAGFRHVLRLGTGDALWETCEL